MGVDDGVKRTRVCERHHERNNSTHRRTARFKVVLLSLGLTPTGLYTVCASILRWRGSKVA
jgi:hypothetical protein